MEDIDSWLPHDVGMERNCLTMSEIFVDKFGVVDKGGIWALEDSCLGIFLGLRLVALSY